MLAADQPPLWPDGWEQEADRKAGFRPDDLAHTADHLAGYARPCTRTHLPSHRTVTDVLETL